MRKRRSFQSNVPLVVLLALVVLSSSFLAAQQTINATLSGTISDPTGAVLSGAKVTLLSPELGITRTYTTDDTGNYTFSLLPPANYNLRVEAGGFKTYKQDGISLAAGQTARQTVTLVTGAIAETVEVTTQAPLLNADNANVSSDISARQVVELPLNQRNVYGLAFLSSSVNNSSEFQVVGGNGISGSADQDISFFNFGGTFFDTAAFLLDGTWDTGSDWGGVAYVPSTDSVQEFKIQTNAFTAQYGWSSGNFINVVTKSGTNRFHGDAYYFLRNSSLDARNYFNDNDQPLFHRHQFGVTAGGPIWKNKTYFFAYYEGLRQQTPVTFNNTVPTPAMLAGDFSAQLGGQALDAQGQPIFDDLGRPVLSGAVYDPFTVRQVTQGQTDPSTGLVATNSGFVRDPFSGNIIPSGRFDPIAANIVAGNYWPTPNNGNNFTSSAAAAARSNEYSVRIDHNLSENSRLNARWSQKFESKVNVPTYFGESDPGGPGAINPNNRWSFDLAFNHVFSPAFLMNLNFGINRWVEGSHVQSFGFQASTLGLPNFIDSISPLFPQIQPEGVNGLGPQAGLDEYMVPRNLGTFTADFTKIVGRHNLQFGFMQVLNQINGGHYFTTSLQFPQGFTGGPDPQSEVSGTGAGVASFLLGVGGGQTGVNQFPASEKKQLGWYLQDDWKLNRKLTLNLGLRYEIQTSPTERFNRQAYFDFKATNPISSQVGFDVPGQLVFNTDGNRGVYDTPHTNFAPRVGLSYQFRDKLVFRSGYGIFFLPAYYGNGPILGYSQGTPWVGTLDNGLHVNNTLSNAFPNGQVPALGDSLGNLTNVGFGLNPITNPDRPSSYAQQWMAGFQYSLTNNDLLDLTYVGNSGTHMLAQYVEWNELPTADLSLGNALIDQVPNPFFGAITGGSGCGLDQPTVARGQLLRPFPEYCSVTEAQPAVGTSNYNALQATYTHRWHAGLNVTVSYTYSKFLDNVNGASGWAFAGSNQIRDFYNLSREKSVDSNDIPHSLVVNYVYELPVGRGKRVGSDWNGPVNAILGGWQLSGIVTAKSGFPLSVVPNNNSNSLGGGQRTNLVPGVDPRPDNQTIEHWINPAAFVAPEPYTFGDAPRYMSNLRSPKYTNWDMAIQKYWHFGEAMRLQFRVEMFNTLNHPNFFAPNQSFGSPTFGTITQAYPARDVQAALKFYW